MIKIDLHTHSIASKDGGLTERDYEHMLHPTRLGCIAITDHDRIDFAKQMRDRFGEQIIIGEEISTTEGDIIGLYLTSKVQPGLSALQTASEIRNQGGLVYIPHPFETFRKGLSGNTLNQIASIVDIIEGYNGRTLQNKSNKAIEWAKHNDRAVAASSDAHSRHGIGKTFTFVPETPRINTLVQLLNQAEYRSSKPSPFAYVAPKFNRLRKKFRHN